MQKNEKKQEYSAHHSFDDAYCFGLMMPVNERQRL
jgi:hypothetical protein